MKKANTRTVRVFLSLVPCCSLLSPWMKNAASLSVYPGVTIFCIQCHWIPLTWFFFSLSDRAINFTKAESKLNASFGFAWHMTHTGSHRSLLTLWNQIKMKSLLLIQIKIYRCNEIAVGSNGQSGNHSSDCLRKLCIWKVSEEGDVSLLLINCVKLSSSLDTTWNGSWLHKAI